MTEAGLNTINLSQMNTFQQFILFLLILLGSAIWVSIAVVRKAHFYVVIVQSVLLSELQDMSQESNVLFSSSLLPKHVS